MPFFVFILSQQIRCSALSREALWIYLIAQVEDKYPSSPIKDFPADAALIMIRPSAVHAKPDGSPTFADFQKNISQLCGTHVNRWGEVSPFGPLFRGWGKIYFAQKEALKVGYFLGQIL